VKARRKCGRWKSSKFKGVRKDIQSPIVVAISNAMPNISTISVDRRFSIVVFGK